MPCLYSIISYLKINMLVKCIIAVSLKDCFAISAQEETYKINSFEGLRNLCCYRIRTEFCGKIQIWNNSYTSIINYTDEI
jgi:hypothetical protein